MHQYLLEDCMCDRAERRDEQKREEHTEMEGMQAFMELLMKAVVTVAMKATKIN